MRESISEAIPGHIAPIFKTTIRHLESAAADARKHGLLAHELEGATASAKKARLKALRDKVKPPSLLLSRDATGLADDYEALALLVTAIMAVLCYTGYIVSSSFLSLEGSHRKLEQFS